MTLGGRFLLLAAAGILLPAFCLAAPPASPPKGSAPVPLVERYRQALSLDPENLPLRYHLGIALLMEGDNKGAVEAFRKAYPAFTDSPEMNFNLGLAYTRLGDPDSALLYLDQAEGAGALGSPALYPMASALYNVALLYLEGGNGPEAVRLLERVLTLDPERKEIYRLIGETQARARQTEKALAAFASYLEAYPDDLQVREYLFSLHYNRGLEVLGKGDGTAARGAFEKALAYSPESPLALYYLGYIDYSAGNHPAAAARLQDLYPRLPENLKPSAASLLYNCALALLQGKRADLAASAIAPLVGADSRDSKALYLAGNIELERQGFGEARRLYERVLSLDKKHRGAALNLVVAEQGMAAQLVAEGRELFRKGEFAAAAETLTTAQAINPADAVGRAYLEEARRELGNEATGLLKGGGKALEAGDARSALDLARRALVLDSSAAGGRALEEKALAALSGEIGRLLATGASRQAAGDYGAAEETFARVLRLDPERAEALEGRERAIRGRRAAAAKEVARGVEALEQGRLPEALTSLRRGQQLHPDSPEAAAGLARAEALVGSLVAEERQWGRRAVSEGRLDAAREHFQKALKLRDDKDIRRELAALDGTSSRRVGALVEEGGRTLSARDYRRASDLYRQALALDPGHRGARQGLDKAQSAARQAIETLLVSADKAFAAGDTGSGLTRLREILAIDPADSRALAGLEGARSRAADEAAGLVAQGNASLAAGRTAEAESLLRQALAIDPYLPEARAALERLSRPGGKKTPSVDLEQRYLEGISLYTQGRYEAAVSIWGEVLQKDPGHEKARRNIEKARRKLEQIKERQGG